MGIRITITRRTVEEKAEDKPYNYRFAAISALIFVSIVKWLWPWAIPFDMLHFWRIQGTIGSVLSNYWPLLVWGVCVLAYQMIRRGARAPTKDARYILYAGAYTSLRAGVWEEIAFRWLLFYSAIVGLKVGNWILFGFIGFGIPEMLYSYIIIPIANLGTLYGLDWILHGYGWAVGAAVISVNAKFRDGHAYQGFFGYVNAWFGGMILFHIMFTHGLLMAIFMHFLYDLVIDVAAWICALCGIQMQPSEKKQRRSKRRLSAGRAEVKVA